MKKKIAHFATTSFIASTLILSSGIGNVFASETVVTDSSSIDENVTVNEDTTIDTINEATTENQSDEDTTMVSEEGTNDNAVETDEKNSKKVEDPSLVPGDFFYFVKIMAEKIRLAVTVDDYKEAKLLANYAAERISEANALIADGKTDEAKDTLQKAVDQQKLASEIVEVDETTEATIDETSDVVKEESADNDDAETSSKDKKIQTKLAHNIDALVAALENIDNPKAQQALMKNIQKSFAKLDKKIGKIEEKHNKKKANVKKEEAKTPVTETEEAVETEKSTKEQVEDPSKDSNIKEKEDKTVTQVDETKSEVVKHDSQNVKVKVNEKNTSPISKTEITKVHQKNEEKISNVVQKQHNNVSHKQQDHSNKKESNNKNKN